MRYGSLCSGIEAASVAFKPLGWEAAWFSEIEAFPNAVLLHHYPNVPNHGDMTTIRSRIISGEVEAPDMICGGPPCQAFSVAGLRRSLDDERGNLTLEYVKICDATDTVRLAAGRPPAWILYENVPGILNTKDNAFGALLGGLCGSDSPIVAPAGWGYSGVVDGPTRTVAYRVLNAEFFGLAQRRKRVFVLARGGAGRWAVADVLLPIIESSRWHPAPSRGTGKEVAQDACSGTGSDRVEGVDYENNGVEAGEPMGPLMKGSPSGGGRPLPVVAFAQNTRDEGFDASEDGTGSGIPLVMATGQASAMSAPTIDMAPTLSCNHEAPILMRMREGKEGGGKGPLVSEDQSLTLATRNDQVLAVDAYNYDTNEHVSAAISTMAYHNRNMAAQGMQVRRLTPVECCRLQGFPDDYLDITYRGKPAADGNKYKALGNSWAVPVVRWIGERIKAIR